MVHFTLGYLLIVGLNAITPMASHVDIKNTPSSMSEASGPFLQSEQWGFVPEDEHLEKVKKDGLGDLRSSSFPALFLSLWLHLVLSAWSPAVAFWGRAHVMVNIWFLT